MPFGDGIDGIVFGTLTVKRHGHDRPGTSGNGLLQQGGVKVAGSGIDIDKHRPGPQQRYHFGRGNKAERCRDYFIPRPDFQGHQRNQ